MLRFYKLFIQVPLPDAETPFEKQLYYTQSYTVGKYVSGETFPANWKLYT